MEPNQTLDKFNFSSLEAESSDQEQAGPSDLMQVIIFIDFSLESIGVLRPVHTYSFLFEEGDFFSF